MNKYYGLRLIRTFFLVTSVVISVSTVATVGGLGGMSLVLGEELDAIRLFLALVFGGLLALLSYAFGQLIDLNLRNYEVSWQLKEQIEEANRLNNKTVHLLNKQLRLMHAGFNIDQEIDMKKIEQQLNERRNTLSS